MSWLGRACRVLVILPLLLLLAACGSDDDGPSESVVNELLFLLNASENDGRTVRWGDGNLPIPVFRGGVAREDEVREWTRVTEGRVTFFFVGSPPSNGIAFRGASLDTNICGISQIEFEDNRIRSVEVRVNEEIFRGPGCVRTITHETGHAIGIFRHTADGGLMDLDGGNGEVTRAVAQTVRDLYSLSPGTHVGAAQGRRVVARRPGARYTITIVDYARP